MAKKRITIRPGDPTYFVSKSWTLSFNLNTKAWISFHSYIPNFYIGDNNLFYSGLNSCCSDFEFVAGELPNPFRCEIDGYAYQDGYQFDCDINGYCYIAPDRTTTTSTSSTTLSPWPDFTTTTSSSTTSTTSTTQQQDSTTTTSSTTVCIRPSGLDYIYFVIGHDGILTTNDKYACCALMMEVTSNPSHGYIINYIQAHSEGTGIGDRSYAVNGTDDCECLADGWYFSEESSSYGYVFRIENCLVVEHYQCEDSCDMEGEADEYDPNAPTTTTSSTSTSSTTVDPNASTTTTSSTTVDDGCDLDIEVIEPVCIDAHLLSVECGPAPTTTTSSTTSSTTSTTTSSTTSTTTSTTSSTTSTTTTTYNCIVEYDITDMDFST